MGLNDEIAEYLDKVGPHMPVEVKEGLAAALDKLRAQKIAAQARREGERAPDFTLANYRGRLVSSAVLRKAGPLVLSFYRGSW
jgi:hypothetical protein